MQKKLMVLFTFAIFVLVVGWAITPAQAHGTFENCLHKKDSHNHCQPPNGDPPPDDEGDRYSAMVTFRDTDCDDTEVDDRDRFCSDGLDGNSPYVDGLNAVVEGDKFRFSLTLKEVAPMPRKFFLDFSGSCQTPPNPCGIIRPMLTQFVNGMGTVGNKGFTSGTVAENVFSTGHLPEPECVGFSLLVMGVD